MDKIKFTGIIKDDKGNDVRTKSVEITSDQFKHIKEPTNDLYWQRILDETDLFMEKRAVFKLVEIVVKVKACSQKNFK